MTASPKRTHEPSQSDEDWLAEGWATEATDLAVVGEVVTTIAVRFGPDDADTIGRAAKLAAMTRPEFIRRAALAAAGECAAEPDIARPSVESGQP